MLKKHINALQNLLIALLAVSALFLFLRQQTDTPMASYLTPGQTTTGVSDSEEEIPTTAEAVIRIAVSGAYGRYGDLHMTSTSDGFAAIRNLLQEALGSAGTPEKCSETAFRAALDGTSLYCDWTASLPLSAVCGIVGASAPEEELYVRRMVLAAGHDSVTLLLTDDKDYMLCTTKVSVEALLNFISGVQMDTVAFAYELKSNSITPYSLLHTGHLQEYPLLTSSTGTQPADPLLSALGFNPNTNSRYTESNGTEVVRDGERTLRIEPDSTLIYDGGGTFVPEVSISRSDETVSMYDAILCASRTLNQLISDSDASLCLKTVETTQRGWLVTFDYQADGVLLRLSSGEPAASAEVTSNGVTAFTLCLRRYMAEGTENSLLLPLLQALAIADSSQPGELSICYVDSGSTVSAAWLTD